MSEKLKPGRCEFCNARLVVMNTATGSVLPVEIPDGEVTIYDDDEFEKGKYVSHLKNCEPMRMAWEIKKKKWIKKRSLFNLSPKELCK